MTNYEIWSLIIAAFGVVAIFAIPTFKYWKQLASYIKNKFFTSPKKPFTFHPILKGTRVLFMDLLLGTKAQVDLIKKAISDGIIPNMTEKEIFEKAQENISKKIKYELIDEETDKGNIVYSSEIENGKIKYIIFPKINTLEFIETNKNKTSIYGQSISKIINLKPDLIDSADIIFKKMSKHNFILKYKYKNRNKANIKAINDFVNKHKIELSNDELSNYLNNKVKLIDYDFYKKITDSKIQLEFSNIVKKYKKDFYSIFSWIVWIKFKNNTYIKMKNNLLMHSFLSEQLVYILLSLKKFNISYYFSDNTESDWMNSFKDLIDGNFSSVTTNSKNGSKTYHSKYWIYEDDFY